MSNAGGAFTAPREEGSMEQFDQLPPEIRAILRNAPYSVSTASVTRVYATAGTKHTIEWMRKGIDSVMKDSTLLTYGPDHPNA